jgi:hypothetical protein
LPDRLLRENDAKLRNFEMNLQCRCFGIRRVLHRKKPSKPAEKAAVQEIVTIPGRDTRRKSRALPCEYA